jgi:hypothetical protein
MRRLRRIGRGAAAVCVSGLLLSGGAVLASSGSASAANTAVLTAAASYDVNVYVLSQKGPITVEGKYLRDLSHCTSGSNWSVTVPKLVGPLSFGRPGSDFPRYESELAGHFTVDTSGWCFFQQARAYYQILLQGAPGHALLGIGQVAVRSFVTSCTNTASFYTACNAYGPFKLRVQLVVTPFG